jgi:thiol-disulfide isomerase/thioredoxin
MMDATGEAMPKPTGEAMMDATGEAMPKPTGEAMKDATGEAMAQAAWMTLPLTVARTGQSFTLADFAGRPVYVETMATWCSNCRAQLTSVQEAITALKGQPPVFIALSVETTLSPDQLAQYATDNGFEPIFAVATPELLQGLAAAFGRTITNPPSTPHFLIQPDGSHGELMTGFSSAERIVELLQVASAGA